MASVHTTKKYISMDESFPIAIVDFNFSALSKEFASINECSIYDYNKGTGQTFHILPDKPLPSTRQSNFTTQFFHKIPLQFGACELHAFGTCVNIILQRYLAILVKGQAKEDVLSQLVEDSVNKNVFNLDKFGCPNLEQLRSMYTSTQQTFCIFHTPHYEGCTAMKSAVIERWLTDNYDATKYYINRKMNDY